MAYATLRYQEELEGRKNNLEAEKVMLASKILLLLA
jgi:hypothetical protein